MASKAQAIRWKMEDGMPVKILLPETSPVEVMLQDCPGQWHTTEDSTKKGVLMKYNKGSQPGRY